MACVRSKLIILAEWLSGNLTSPATWSMKTTGSSIYLQAVLNDPQPFTESANRALDGTAYYAMASVRTTFARLHIYYIPNLVKAPALTWQMDTFFAVHQQFNQTGALNNAAASSTGNLGL